MRAWFWTWIWMRLLIESRLESESDWACRLRIEPTANLAGRGNCKSWADVKVKVKVAITRSTAPAPISKHARRTAHVLILTLVAKYMAHPHHPTNRAIAWLVLLCRSFIFWYFFGKTWSSLVFFYVFFWLFLSGIFGLVLLPSLLCYFLLRLVPFYNRIVPVPCYKESREPGYQPAC